MRRPLLVLVPTVAVLLAAAAPALFLRLTPGSLASLPQTTESAPGLAALGERLRPRRADADAGRRRRGRAGARAPARRARRGRRGSRTRCSTTRRCTSSRAAARQPYVSRNGRYARVIVVGRHEYGAPASRRLVDRVRGELVPPRASRPVRVLVGGAPPKGVDFLARAYAFFPWLVLIALALTYLVLARAFRSLLLPLKAVLLNLLSVAASYGLLVAVFRFGVGAGAARRPALRADRRLDPDLPVRDALRPLDGLRGVPRVEDARVVGRGATTTSRPSRSGSSAPAA